MILGQFFWNKESRLRWVLIGFPDFYFPVVCNNTYHIMDMNPFGNNSHQYQLPLAEKTAISMPTKVPL